MSSRRKCDKRHIGFLTSIYIEGISQTVCSFALQILRQELLHCFREKLGMCVVVVAMHSLLPRWVMYGRRPRCKRNLTISEAFGCGHVFGL